MLKNLAAIYIASMITLIAIYLDDIRRTGLVPVDPTDPAVAVLLETQAILEAEFAAILRSNDI